MIELGGNIRLDGFSEVKPADLVIIKKLIGNHVKGICDKSQDFKDILVRLNASTQSPGFLLETTLFLDKEYHSNAQGPNLFFTLDRAFKNLHGQLP